MRDWLAHRVTATPDAEALVTARSGRQWTYAELDAAADAMAGRFAGLGVEPGDHVCVAMRNRPQYVTLLHAAMRLGVRLVPLPSGLTAAELGPRLERADATLLVCDADTEAVAVEATATVDDGGAPTVDDGTAPAEPADAALTDPDVAPAAGDMTPARPDPPPAADDGPDGAAPSVPVVSVDDPGWERVAHLRSAPDEAFEPASWERSDPLVMLFTSGSTGSPKLVTLTMGNVLSSAVASAFRLGVTPDDRYLATLSLHHTGGIMPLYRATLYGTSVVLRSGFDPGETADDLRKYDVTGVSLVPTMLRRMLDARGTLSDSLRVVLVGGAPAPADLVERCHDYSIPIHPTYGMTEAASQIATARPEEAEARPGTVGRPQFWTDLTVRGEDGGSVPPGETGELVVSGPSVTPGYYGDRDATDAAFGDDGLRTGDAGYRDDDGYVYVVNRVDDRIVTGGENVDPGEVVAVLREHPGVDDAAVVGLDDEEWGERVGALVVPAGAESDPSAEDVESFCRERLAPFKLPRTIRFRDDLPRTDTGTVERPAVRDLLADVDEPREDDGADAPTDPGGEHAPSRSGTDAAGGGREASGEQGGDGPPADDREREPDGTDAGDGAGTDGADDRAGEGDRVDDGGTTDDEEGDAADGATDDEGGDAGAGGAG